MSADYLSMTTAEIRFQVLNFEERGLKFHLFVPRPRRSFAAACQRRHELKFKEYHQARRSRANEIMISARSGVPHSTSIDFITGSERRWPSPVLPLRCSATSPLAVPSSRLALGPLSFITKEFSRSTACTSPSLLRTTRPGDVSSLWALPRTGISRLGEDDNLGCHSALWALAVRGSEIYF